MKFFKKLKNVIMVKATWTKALVCLFLSQIAYMFMLFVTIPNIEKQADGMKIFDLMPFGYSLEYAVTLLSHLGEEGREMYLTSQIPLDLIYPFLMGITGSFFIALLTKNIHERFGVLVFLPLIAALFDYLENGMIAIMLWFFPSISGGIIFISSSFSILKSLFTTVYIGVLLLLFISFFINLFQKKYITMKR